MPDTRTIQYPISRITVNGFKSINREQSIDFKPLTLLAGSNSSGKSSMMQPLLLLKQTLEATFDPGPLLIDGPNVKFTALTQMFSRLENGKHGNTFLIKIGHKNEIGVSTLYSRVAGKLTIRQTIMTFSSGSIQLRDKMSHEELVEQGQKLVPSFAEGPDEGSLSVVQRERCFLKITEKRQVADGIWNMSTIFNPSIILGEDLNRLIHLPGLRGNPTRIYQRTATGPAYPGTFEQYTATIVALWQITKDVEKLDQLSANLRQLGLTQNISTKAINDTQIELRVSRTMKQSEKEDLVNIADAGFGVSQVLPILVALIAAAPGQVVYIEQPEIHLHPRAQSIMAEILADAANRGVIVVAETHSDLLLLGVQTLVAQGKLSPDKVILHWFQRDQEGSTKIDTATLDESGSFGDWPEDFGQVALEAESRYLDAAEAAQQKGK